MITLSIVVNFNAKCELCEKVIAGTADKTTAHIQAVSKILRNKYGWTVTKDNKTYCPECRQLRPRKKTGRKPEHHLGSDIKRYNNKVNWIENIDYVSLEKAMEGERYPISERTKDVCYSYYVENKTLEEIGKKWNVSRSMIHIIIQKFIAKVCKYLSRLDSVAESKTNEHIHSETT